MNQELKILALADYYEKFTVNQSSAYLIINKKMTDHQCMFGFVQLSDSLSDAEQLFTQMENRAKEMGYNTLVGPINYCSWMSYRWTISNYDLKLYPDCNNPEYYCNIIQKLGYRQLYTYRSALINLNNPLYDIGKQTYEEKLSEGYTFKLFEGETAYSLTKEIFEISQDAFQGSYFYCDIPFEYFQQLYLTWIKGVNIVMYVAYFNGEPVGYVMGYDSPYGDCFISKTSAVKKSCQKNKLYTVLLYLGCEHVKNLGYENMMYHFQCEQKDIFRRFDTDVESNEKRYAVFVKELTK